VPTDPLVFTEVGNAYVALDVALADLRQAERDARRADDAIAEAQRARRTASDAYRAALTSVDAARDRIVEAQQPYLLDDHALRTYDDGTTVSTYQAVPVDHPAEDGDHQDPR
jgi:hypothetical protein